MARAFAFGLSTWSTLITVEPLCKWCFFGGSPLATHCLSSSAALCCLHSWGQFKRTDDWSDDGAVVDGVDFGDSFKLYWWYKSEGGITEGQVVAAAKNSQEMGLVVGNSSFYSRRSWPLRVMIKFSFTHLSACVVDSLLRFTRQTINLPIFGTS